MSIIAIIIFIAQKYSQVKGKSKLEDKSWIMWKVSVKYNVKDKFSNENIALLLQSIQKKQR